MWEQIRSNRTRSFLVVTGMAVLLGVVGAALGLLFGGEGGLWVGVAAALAVWLVLWAISVSRCDDLMLRIAGAQEVSRSDFPMLHNVVEEMAIAAALPVKPRVFVIEDDAPNAFATGRRPDKAAVTVTTGLLRRLDRDELQGVVAHEIGHVRNRDVALMVTAGIMLGSVALLAAVGRRALWWGGGRVRSRSGGDGAPQAAAVALALLVVVLAPIFAQLLYFALSRRREYLADACGAAFTRYPEGLARALEKISGVRVPARSVDPVTAPMYIVPPLPAEAMAARGARRPAWFSTHPPVEERIRILRSMAGAGIADYETAFERVRGRRLVRNAEAPGPGLPAHAAAVAPAPDPSGGPGPAERARAANDALLKARGYRLVPCPVCGAVNKLPPPLARAVDRCLRCGGRLPGA